ncbi:MAG: hypothetical protein ACRD8O_13275 [Bryobacteraceae bacterium]
MRTSNSLALALTVALAAPVAHAQQSGPQTPALDTTTFVVLGEGLAAGMSDFGLRDVGQRFSFPALVARQIGAPFPQPLIQGPGIGDVFGQAKQPVVMPRLPQNQVRAFPAQPNPNDDAPALFVFNLSVPGMKLADSASRRPVSPLIHDRDMYQTSINLILGFPSLILERDVPLWTQLEYAKAMTPTAALVALGYHEVLEAAVNGDPALIPTAATFRQNYTNVVKQLRDQQVQVIATTIPDPMDTAYVTPVLRATEGLLAAPPFVLLLGYNLRQDDLITRPGIYTIGTQLFRRAIEPLPPGSILSAATGRDITARVRALNTEIANVARENGAVLYDLYAFTNRVRAGGVRAGNRTLTANYLGGFYSLDGYYPGSTGHALIANEILGLLNRTYGRSFPLVDLGPVMREDAALEHRLAPAATLSAAELGFSEQ